MPLYEYQCQKCEKVFEVLVRLPAGQAGSDKDAKGLCCPSCECKKVNKMFSTFCTNSGQRVAASASSQAGCSSCSSGSCSTCG